MGDTGIRYKGGVDARPLLICVLQPEVRDWVALEDEKEQIEEGECDDDSQRSEDDASVQRSDRYAEEEYGDGEADEDGRYCVEEFTEPPEIEGFRDVLDGDVFEVPSCSVCYAGEGTCCVRRKEYLENRSATACLASM